MTDSRVELYQNGSFVYGEDISLSPAILTRMAVGNDEAKTGGFDGHVGGVLCYNKDYTGSYVGQINGLAQKKIFEGAAYKETRGLETGEPGPT
jgi:hypothetical protein